MSVERRAWEVEDALVPLMHQPKSWNTAGTQYKTYCGRIVPAHSIGSWGRESTCPDCDREAEKAAETLVRWNKARP